MLKKQGKTPPSLTHLPSRIHSRSHCPPHAPPLVRSTAVGAAYGTARSGTGVATAGIMHPDAVMKSIIPVVMAGIIAIYGLVVAVLIGNGMADATQYSLFKGFLDLGSGLAVGIAGLAAGYAIGVVGDTGVRGTGMQPKVTPALLDLSNRHSPPRPTARRILHRAVSLQAFEHHSSSTRITVSLSFGAPCRLCRRAVVGRCRDLSASGHL